jgi:hypothetical protein
MTEEDEAFEELSKRQGYWGLQGSRKHQIMRYAENVETKGTSMTDKEAMKLALFALDIVKIHYTQNRYVNEAIAALKERLTQPEQEPVAWMYINTDGECEQIEYGEPFDDPSTTPLYTTPPQRTWVGLTDEDIGDAYVAWDDTNGASFADFARAIEAKLKQKNGYAEENT